MKLYDISLINFEKFPVQNLKLKEQTDAFESVMIKILLDNSMQNSMSIFSKKDDSADRIYNSMYREELARVSAGGFGFSQILYEYLSNKV